MSRAKANGFTIVELLIVIVVIGILSGITVIAFSGVKERAEEAVLITRVKSIAETFELYGAANDGRLPQADWACIGEPEDFPATNGYAAGWCVKPDQAEPIPGGNFHPINPTVNEKLRTVAGRVPDGNIPEVNYPGGYTLKGIMYDSSNSFGGGFPILNFYVKGYSATKCPIGERITGSPFMNYTRCMYVFRGYSVE